MIALGIDNGLANLGWALVDIGGKAEKLVDLGVVTTKKSDRKRNILASSDNMRRIREQARALIALPLDEVAIVFVEAQSWPRSAGSSAKIGMSWGIVGAIAEIYDLPIVEATPQEIKLAIAGDKTASKERMKEALGTRQGFEGLGEHLSAIPKTRHEHPVDACGAIIAGLSSELSRAIRRQR